MNILTMESKVLRKDHVWLLIFISISFSTLIASHPLNGINDNIDLESTGVNGHVEFENETNVPIEIDTHKTTKREKYITTEKSMEMSESYGITNSPTLNNENNLQVEKTTHGNDLEKMTSDINLMVVTHSALATSETGLMDTFRNVTPLREFTPISDETIFATYPKQTSEKMTTSNNELLSTMNELQHNSSITDIKATTNFEENISSTRDYFEPSTSSNDSFLNLVASTTFDSSTINIVNNNLSNEIVTDQMIQATTSSLSTSTKTLEDLDKSQSSTESINQEDSTVETITSSLVVTSKVDIINSINSTILNELSTESNKIQTNSRTTNEIYNDNENGTTITTTLIPIQTTTDGQSATAFITTNKNTLATDSTPYDVSVSTSTYSTLLTRQPLESLSQTSKFENSMIESKPINDSISLAPSSSVHTNSPLNENEVLKSTTISVFEDTPQHNITSQIISEQTTEYSFLISSSINDIGDDEIKNKTTTIVSITADMSVNEDENNNKENENSTKSTEIIASANSLEPVSNNLTATGITMTTTPDVSTMFAQDMIPSNSSTERELESKSTKNTFEQTTSDLGDSLSNSELPSITIPSTIDRELEYSASTTEKVSSPSSSFTHILTTPFIAETSKTEIYNTSSIEISILDPISTKKTPNSSTSSNSDLTNIFLSNNEEHFESTTEKSSSGITSQTSPTDTSISNSIVTMKTSTVSSIQSTPSISTSNSIVTMETSTASLIQSTPSISTSSSIVAMETSTASPEQSNPPTSTSTSTSNSIVTMETSTASPEQTNPSTSTSNSIVTMKTSTAPSIQSTPSTSTSSSIVTMKTSTASPEQSNPSTSTSNSVVAMKTSTAASIQSTLSTSNAMVSIQSPSILSLVLPSSSAPIISSISPNTPNVIPQTTESAPVELTTEKGGASTINLSVISVIVFAITVALIQF